MKSNPVLLTKEKKYSRLFSSLFCSMAILTLSALCLLNNFSIDLYSTTVLLKVVLPGAFCFWILGYIIGFILDNKEVSIVKTKAINEKKAYEIPSMFSSKAVGVEEQNSEIEGL